MRRERISCQPAHSVADVVESDNMKERNFFVPAPGQHPPLRVPGAPYRMSVTPWEPPGPPPALNDSPATEWTSDRATLPDPGEDAGSLPLKGVRVIDLGQVWAGPLCSRYLADYGADVILVDTATRPRALPQTFDTSSPITWESIHRNRRSVHLDLRTPKGVELFKRLLSTADVMVDNFTPRALANLGLKYEELAEANPRLIIAALSAAGRTGPWADVLTYGPALTALFGVKSLYGYPEEGVMLEDASDLDPIAGTTGALAIMAALHHRDRTGEGQMIEIAQGEVGFIAMTEAMIEHLWNGRDMGRVGNQHRVAGAARHLPLLRRGPLDRYRLRIGRGVERARSRRRAPRVAGAGRLPHRGRPPRSPHGARRRNRGVDALSGARGADRAVAGGGRRRDPGDARVRLPGRPSLPAPPRRLLRTP